MTLWVIIRVYHGHGRKQSWDIKADTDGAQGSLKIYISCVIWTLTDHFLCQFATKGAKPAHNAVFILQLIYQDFCFLCLSKCLTGNSWHNNLSQQANFSNKTLFVPTSSASSWLLMLAYSQQVQQVQGRLLSKVTKLFSLGKCKAQQLAYTNIKLTCCTVEGGEKVTYRVCLKSKTNTWVIHELQQNILYFTLTFQAIQTEKIKLLYSSVSQPWSQAPILVRR